MVERPFSPLDNYLEAYRQNPRGTAFAPLAEYYRRMGQIERALSLLKEGLRHHPQYLIAYVGLAQCYCDLDEFELAYSTLKPFIAANKENIKLQQVYAQVCYELKFYSEALEAYKVVLFFHPKNLIAMKMVKELEERMNYSSVNSTSSPVATGPTFEDLDRMVPINKVVTNEDDWKPINLIGKTKNNAEKKSSVSEQSASVENGESNNSMTLTLVDLYIEQGYQEEAKDLLNKILMISPENKLAKAKLASLKEQERQIYIQNNQGLIDKLNKFNDAIKKKAFEMRVKHRNLVGT